MSYKVCNFGYDAREISDVFQHKGDKSAYSKEPVGISLPHPNITAHVDPSLTGAFHITSYSSCAIEVSVSDTFTALH